MAVLSVSEGWFSFCAKDQIALITKISRGLAGVSEDALTRGDPYPDQARLSLQCERTIPCSSTLHFTSTVRLEEAASARSGLVH